MQNRHFVRPKVAVPFALHVNDEVVAHVTDLASAWSRFPTQSECQCALRIWGRGKHQSGQSPSSFPLARIYQSRDRKGFGEPLGAFRECL